MMVAYSAELWVLMAVDTIVWGMVVMLALWRRLPFTVRATGFVGIWLVLACLLLWIVGPVGSGPAWLLSVPVLSALFFGYRGAAAGVGLVVLAAIVFWLLLPVHQSGGFLAAGPSYSSESWIASASSLIFLSALLSWSIARLLRGLQDSLRELEISHRQVSETLQERERLQGELLRSQKHSALGTLASGIAHDFNNILVPILVASEEARDEAAPDSAQREHLDRVISSALRARNLIRRILDFSRSSLAERRPTPVEPILREVGALLRSSAPAGITIEYRLRAPGAHVLGDPGEVHQVLMNLGTNACLAMKDRGGTLTLSLDRAGGMVAIGVEDTGCGIPPQFQERIFDPFFTTRDAGGGTGLGLAIVHRLVTSMAGTVTFDSAPERGTRFTLRFPEAPQEPDLASDPGPGNTSNLTPAGPRTVLVVDDEDLVRGMISIILTRTGYVVREASSPESALRQIHDDPRAIDLVITDQAMPNMSGLRLAQDLRILRPDLPIILVSGHLGSEELERASALPVDGVLDKPFGRRSLLALVERVLAERASHDVIA
jgi:signal transduction histidine kinase/CheY-like chemotaxis protein